MLSILRSSTGEAKLAKKRVRKDRPCVGARTRKRRELQSETKADARREGGEPVMTVCFLHGMV
jgi:hypothetical protein